MKEINYTYSIGSNCDSTFFIRHYKLSKFSGPFDWVYVDFNSALKNIEQKFERYTKDLFYYNPNVNYNNMSIEELKLHLINKEYHNQVDYRLENISDIEFELHPNKSYVKDFYINQHFLPDEITPNLVQWNKSCWFPHHDFKDKDKNNVLKNKINVFNKVYGDNKDNILFIGFNKFETIQDAYYEIRNITRSYHQSDLKSDLFYIILAPTNTPPEIIKHENVTFFLKHFEGIYQFETDDKHPEAFEYLNKIYKFNILEKPNDIEYLPALNEHPDIIDYYNLGY